MILYCMYFTAPSIVECWLCALYYYSTNSKNSSEKVLRALTSCARFPFWEMEPFIRISQYNCLGEGHWFLVFFSVGSLCFGQISSICEVLILLGYYLKYLYSLWYNLLSNCKKTHNISYILQILSGFLHVIRSGEKKIKLSPSMQDCTEPCDRYQAAAVNDLAVQQPFGLKISARIMCLMVPDRLLLGIPWSLGHCIRLLSASPLLFSYQWKESEYMNSDTAFVPEALRRFCS